MKVSATHQRPLLVVVSGPSGSGKGEALRVLTSDCGLGRVVTSTTRSRRPGEKDGREYNFLSLADFRAKQSAGQFLEFNKTYGSAFYASPASLLHFDEDTPDQVLELDPEGFYFVRERSKRRVIGIFIVPTSLDDLDERISRRAKTDDLGERLKVARRQLALSWPYDYLLVNEDLPDFEASLAAVVTAIREDAKTRSHLAALLGAIQSHEARTET